MSNLKKIFISCCTFIFILIVPFSIYAEGYADVIIQTDGTFNNHEVITSCEVGKEITINIGNFDTVYYNNNFNVNIANGDGTATFTCSDSNDLKLAYYGINDLASVSSTVLSTPSIYSNLPHSSNSTINQWLIDNEDNYEWIGTFTGSPNSTMVVGNNDSNYGSIYGYFWYNNTSKSTSLILENPNWNISTLYILKNSSHSLCDLTGLGCPIQTVNIYGNVEPSGSGTVTGTGEYAIGTTVTLTAIANNGYQFVEWSNGSTSNPLTITASTNNTYTAIFTAISQPSQYTVTGSVSPNGSGYIDGLGTYTEGDLVTVSAHAYDGYIFSHWNTGSTSNYLTFNINENRNYIAYFEVDPDYEPPSNTFTISGTVSPDGSGSINGLGTYDIGTSVTLNAIANDGFTFIQWENGDTNAQRVINTSSDISVIAYFVSNDTSNNSLLLESNYIILDYICNDTLSYTYRMNQRIIKGINFDVYAKNSTDINFIKIQEDINEFIIQNVISYTSSNGCYFTPYLTNTETTLLNDGVTLSSRDGAIIYKFVVTEKSDPLIDGTNESNESVDNNNQSNQILDNTISSYDQLEQSFKNDLNNNLGNLDLNFNFGSITDFTRTASFVRTQFDNITSDNPFGLLIGFSLAVGISLLIIGKRL